MTAAVLVERPAVGHYELHFTCAHCGAPCRPVQEHNPGPSGTEISASVQCTDDNCGMPWHLIVWMGISAPTEPPAHPEPISRPSQKWAFDIDAARSRAADALYIT